MSKKGIFALMSCVFALCLALVGCSGGSGGNGQDAKQAFIGTWDLVEMAQGDEVTGADELETLKSLGLEVYVNLNEDGTSALVLFGEVMDGTWAASSATEGTITMEGQDVSMKIEDSKLTFEQEGAKLTFEKGDPKETPSADEEEEADVTDTESAAAEDEESTSEAADEETSSTESSSTEAESSSAAESAASESSSSSSAQ